MENDNITNSEDIYVFGGKLMSCQELMNLLDKLDCHTRSSDDCKNQGDNDLCATVREELCHYSQLIKDVPETVIEELNKRIFL